MASNAWDMLRTGMSAYLDVVFPGEGINIFRVEPPLGGRRVGNLRKSRRRSRGCSVDDCEESALASMESSKGGVDLTTGPSLYAKAEEVDAEEYPMFPGNNVSTFQEDPICHVASNGSFTSNTSRETSVSDDALDYACESHCSQCSEGSMSPTRSTRTEDIIFPSEYKCSL
jgi:hypothetical protein